MSGLCRTLGAAERFLTSSPLQMRKDGFRSRKTQGARCQSGSSESGGSGKKERGRRQRSWATGRVGCRGGATLFLPTPASRASTGVGDGCAFPCLLSSFLGHDFLCMYFLLRFPWCASILSRDRPAEGKGELATCHHRADSGEDLALNSSCHLANASFTLSKRQRRLGTIETNRNGRTRTAPVNSFSSETGSTESWRA